MLREKIAKRLEECFVEAERHYGIKFPRPNKVHYKTNGTCGGWSNYGKKEMMFHLVFADENWDDYFTNTIPHEAAHWVCDHLHGVEYRKDGYGRVITRRGVPVHDHHGPKWQNVMRFCYGLEPDRCHSYSTKNVKTRKVRRWTYKCGKCEHQYQLTTNKHNKNTKFRNNYGRDLYSCKCGGELTCMGEKKETTEEKLARLQRELKALQLQQG